MAVSIQPFRDQITQMIAIAADEARVGCEDGPSVDEWRSHLEAAVDDGLETAEERETERMI